ncbi:MAG: hypothetical protein D3906_04215 [Candidatus Electrothrix sp. AUS1_2]|nr:hypothetical protein [Candidatus Electrothrix sp. AUS1_2]
MKVIKRRCYGIFNIKHLVNHRKTRRARSLAVKKSRDTKPI